MQLSLKQSELVVAVRQYVAKQGLNLNGKDVNVVFSATRGEDGIKATIDIDEADNGPEIAPNMPAQLRVVTAAPALAGIVNTPLTVATEASPFGASSDEPVLVTTTTADIAGEEIKTTKSSLFS